jgi:hypothetical protein
MKSPNSIPDTPGPPELFQLDFRTERLAAQAADRLGMEKRDFINFTIASAAHAVEISGDIEFRFQARS